MVYGSLVCILLVSVFYVSVQTTDIQYILSCTIVSI